MESVLDVYVAGIVYSKLSSFPIGRNCLQIIAVHVIYLDLCEIKHVYFVVADGEAQHCAVLLRSLTTFAESAPILTGRIEDEKFI